MLEAAFVFVVLCLFAGRPGQRQFLGFALEKQNQRALGLPIVFSRNRFHQNVGPMRSAVEANEYRRRQDRFASLECSGQGDAQFGPQFLAHQFGYVGAQRTSLRLEIASGASGKVNDAPGLVDKNARRRCRLERAEVQSVRFAEARTVLLVG